MRRTRGFLLILSLLLVTLMLIMGLAFLNRGANQYRGARQAKSTAQARALAWVGLEQTRAKLDKDLNFPPRLGEDQQFLSLEENVTDLDGTPLGTVVVVLERGYVDPPLLSASSSQYGAGAGCSGPRRSLYTGGGIRPLAHRSGDHHP